MKVYLVLGLNEWDEPKVDVLAVCINESVANNFIDVFKKNSEYQYDSYEIEPRGVQE